MAMNFRKSPLACLGTSFVKLLFGRLKYSKLYSGTALKMKDGQQFTIFRHITVYPLNESKATTVFIVRFKFERLSHKANKIASIIPMLLITGFPGFNTKMYSINNTNGYWQVIYQWKSKQALEDYKKSFVFKMMNKRTIKETMRADEFDNQLLNNFIKELVI